MKYKSLVIGNSTCMNTMYVVINKTVLEEEQYCNSAL